MKKIALLVAGALFVAACSSGAGAAQQSAEEFATTISQAGVVIIDVRTPEEYVAGHIEGALNIPIEVGDFDSAIASLDRETHYAIYCRTGRRSALAVERMSKAGFTTMSELRDGIVSWTGPLVAGN